MEQDKINAEAKAGIKFAGKFRLTCKVPCLSYPKIL